MAADEANLEFKIRADSRQAQEELSHFKARVGSELNVIRGNFGNASAAISQEVNSVAQSLSTGAGSAGRFAAALGPAGLAIGAAAGAAVGLGSALVSVIQSAADAGDRFADLHNQTGLSVETLSGLDLALRQNGATLDTLANSMFFVTKNMGEAKNKGGEMAAAFTRLGVDLNAGPEEALRQVAAGLAKIPDLATRNELGAQVMGRGYKQLSLFINNTNGDIDGLIDTARRAGQVMSGEAAEAADEFKDHLEALSLSAERLEGRLGGILIPEINRLARAFGETQVQGSLLDGVFAGIASQARYMTDQVLTAASAVQAFIAAGTGADFQNTFQSILAGNLTAAGTKPGASNRAARGASSDLTGGVGVFASPAGAARAAAPRVARSAPAAAEDPELEATRRAIRKVQDWTREANREREEAERRIADITEEMAGRRADASDKVREAIRAEVADLTDENTHLTKINDTIREAEILGAIDARTAAWLRQLAVLNDIEETVNNVSSVPVGDITTPGGKNGPYVDPAAFEAEAGKPPPVPDLKPHIDAMETFKSAGRAAFGGVASAFGSMITAFAMGEKGAAKSFGAMAKAAISAMAGQAAVSALFQLAEGLAWLFINPPKAAAHFQSAAVFGVVAGMAGAGAALIPGGGSATGSAFGSSGAGGASGFGSSTRDNGPRVIEQSRNTVIEHVHIVRFEPNPSATITHIEQDVRGNGRLRGLIIETAAA